MRESTIRVAVLTISDSVVAGTREDLSGPEIQKQCEKLGWSVVQSATVPDEVEAIAQRLEGWVEEEAASLILTTGGTGIALRDVTPEATRRVIEREIPGLGELMRMRGLEQTKFAPLSRAVVGSRKRTLIVNLPGSPKGALFSLKTIEELTPHLLDLLHGNTEHTTNAKLGAVTVTPALSKTSYEHE